ncbi:YqgE/AlgH family protein [Buchnera aphidicola]|uniref:YqgE/AlgH family protein n=1 Tax=Buchnera aphidicola TaxID=9 RepID=UPI0005C572D6|nr:YqgE/AlgH family protein [Buchnera aphidicola]
MNFKNHFLIAMPGLKDPLFKNSVIYMCKHDNNGAMGIIINKKIKNLTIQKILHQLKINIKSSNTLDFKNPVIIGGPILEDRGFILHTFKKKFTTSTHISNDLSITTSRDILEYIANLNNPKNILMALGHCIWKQHQLEQEIAKNIWLTTPADIDIIFNTPISEKWKKSMYSIGIMNILQLTSEIGHA